jgi:hypothetical protein
MAVAGPFVWRRQFPQRRANVAVISKSERFGTQVEAVAPRITIDWNPSTNDGPVAFSFEQLTTKTDGTVLERGFMGILPAKISDLLAQDYEITHPVTGEVIVEPGWKLMAMIKAATDSVWEATNPAAPGIVWPLDEGGG